MALFLIDSDVCIDALNGKVLSQQLIRRLSQSDDICTCDVVLTEIYYGTYPEAEARTRELFEPMIFLPTSRNASIRAGRLRFQFARQGVQLGLPDSLVAATAIDHSATVVTANVRHFQIAGLTLLPVFR